MADNFKERFSQAVKETETVVYSYLPEETGHQKTIFEAMNYSVKAGGKRSCPGEGVLFAERFSLR